MTQKRILQQQHKTQKQPNLFPSKEQDVVSYKLFMKRPVV